VLELNVSVFLSLVFGDPIRIFGYRQRGAFKGSPRSDEGRASLGLGSGGFSIALTTVGPDTNTTTKIVERHAKMESVLDGGFCLPLLRISSPTKRRKIKTKVR
jgi:hypothetical protein